MELFLKCLFTVILVQSTYGVALIWFLDKEDIRAGKGGTMFAVYSLLVGILSSPFLVLYLIWK